MTHEVLTSPVMLGLYGVAGFLLLVESFMLRSRALTSLYREDASQHDVHRGSHDLTLSAVTGLTGIGILAALVGHVMG